MSGKLLASFSNSGRYYAHICNDGKLRIWDVISNSMKQEYTPDIHLTSPYTDLRWIILSKKVDLASGNRKRKSSSSFSDIENECLLLGSKSGDIFLYSVSSYSVVRTFKNCHNDRINSIVWCRNVPKYFVSSSEDQFVVQWDIEEGSVTRKWKCGKTSCIAMSDDGKSLIAAKKDIRWLDISGEKEKTRKTFIGHPTDVFSLTFVQICGESCVLSAALGNRYIHAWLLNSDVQDRNAFATFALDDAMISISVFNNSTGGLDISASSKTGVLHLYQCVKNGKKHTKPVKPKLSIQIASESGNENARVEQIPIIGSAFCDENSAYIVYGHDIILCFEKLDLISSEKCKFIVRQDPRKKLLANQEQSLNKILPTISNKSAQYISSDAVNGFYSGSGKRPQKRTIENRFDVALEERLENLVVDMPSTSNAPSSESLVHLLLQGLKSKDPRILQDVLTKEDENIIKATVSRLPIQAIFPLSQELITMVGKRTLENCSAVKWLRNILVIHAAHLISNPDVTDVFSPIFPLIESKLNVIGPLCRLTGRLDMMIQQINHRTDEYEQSLRSVSSQPKLIYQDEDSDEDNEKNENNIIENEVASNDGSESGNEHWDEMSEIDDSGQEQSQDGDMDVVE